jgi:hypothetical protein
MSDLEKFLRPPFGNSSSQVGTLDPFESAEVDNNGPTVPIEDSLCVVSVDGPPSMTDDDDVAGAAAAAAAAAAAFRHHGGKSRILTPEISGCEILRNRVSTTTET